MEERGQIKLWQGRYDRSKWLRKEAGTTLELRTSYEIRERRVCMKPQTKLDQRRN